MEILINTLPFILMMLATGVIAGILAGLLGVGGGIVIVPVLDTALGFYGVDSTIRMHIAVATSLACIIFISISSSRAHHKKGAVDLKIIRVWGIAIFVGSFIGSMVASSVDTKVLSAIFSIVALFVAIKMTLPVGKVTIEKNVTKGILAPVPPLMVGGLSSMIGIGGGTFNVPLLTFMGLSVHKSVGTAALLGLFISVPGVIGFIIAGIDDPRLPLANFGYVNVLGFALITPISFFTTPIGVKIAHYLSQRQLSSLFGVFLFMVAFRMIYRVFVS